MVISRVITRETLFGALITLLITYLLSPLPLQVIVVGFPFLRSDGRENFDVSRVSRPGVWGNVSTFSSLVPEEQRCWEMMKSIQQRGGARAQG